MTSELQKKTLSLDDYLNKVDYSYLNSNKYTPSTFALTFINFIKLVNGEQGESNVTPAFHLTMLDDISSDALEDQYVVNLCFRGAGKTSLLIEYLSLYLGVFGVLGSFGTVNGMIYVTDSMENGAKAARKNIQFRYNNSEFLKKWIPEANFTDSTIEFVNRDGNRFAIKLFGAKTGLRGTKIYGKRPELGVMDDLVSDDDARSPTVLAAIKDTIYRGINHALSPTKRKIMLSGTPFNEDDPMVEAVNSGTWKVNTFPVCEKFPCSKEEFVGAWSDRFTYAYVKNQYDIAVSVGQVAGFYQELMLRISVTENRLVEERNIILYDRNLLTKHKHKFNFYITSDFATSVSKGADFNVLSVWAYSNSGNWFWYDGIVEVQTMDKTIDALFRLVIKYKPLSVGIENSGQQGGFISWIQKEMLERNIWFNLASSSDSTRLGIYPRGDKLTRFSRALPLFAQGKIQFPNAGFDKEMGEFLMELRMATRQGFKSKHDDCIDTISMLTEMNPIKPAIDRDMSKPHNSVDTFFDDDIIEQEVPLANYIV